MIFRSALIRVRIDSRVPDSVTRETNIHRAAQLNVDGNTRLIHPGRDDTSFEKKRRNPLACWLFRGWAVQKGRYKFFMKPGTLLWGSL